ncbi:hypothetical protein [Occallatibacter riparius]|uniref:Uncharacterized protein n=1 Tax=Occallatibacter riparius TaxID=1002689 RepID=A0A9J7BUV9_9BACT|nr:hypothetical protein [Occallatibacter riparius]UWZ86408.1 hypothetical protein MOP44_10795 [Occallatibacter riparius]
MSRRGLLRKRVLPLLGFYPWRCDLCDHEGFFRQRRATQTDEPSDALDRKAS